MRQFLGLVAAVSEVPCHYLIPKDELVASLHIEQSCYNEYAVDILKKSGLNFSPFLQIQAAG